MAPWIIVMLLMALGFIGCFINKFPGQLLAFIALLICKIWIEIPFDWWVLICVGLLVLASMYTSRTVVPKMAKKVAPFTKGATGTTLGSILGVILFAITAGGSAVVTVLMAIVGLLLIPFACAYAFEKTVQKDNSQAIASAIGATTVYMANTFLKLLVFVTSIYCIFYFS